MGSTRDLVLSGMADSVASLMRRPLEDVIYEILDRRKVPHRTEFEALQAEVESLRREKAALEERLGRLEKTLARDMEELRMSMREVVQATVEAALVSVEKRQKKSK